MIGIVGSGEDKSWPIQYMTQLIAHIQKHYDFNILFNYILSQQSTVDKIISGLPNLDKIYPELIEATVREFLKILYHCDAFVGHEGARVTMSDALDHRTSSMYSAHSF